MATASSGEKVQGFVDVNGVHTYYEAAGSGHPLLLLHGGMCPIETFAGLIPELSSSFRVYTPERRGQGRTPDVEGPLTFEAMADDTVAFLEKLALAPVHLVG